MEKQGKRYAKRVNKDTEGRTFAKGDLVWVHLCKERFPHPRKSKLLPRGIGIFPILKKINDNAYVLDVPQEYGRPKFEDKFSSRSKAKISQPRMWAKLQGKVFKDPSLGKVFKDPSNNQ
ncbi:hypothetical protein CR513_12597, partial [Mucuna pruriens]